MAWFAAAAPYIYTTLAAAAAGTAAYASYESGRQQRNAAEANAKMAEYQAKQAKDAANAKAEAYKREAARRMATMRASYGVSGVTMEGTPLLVMMESASEAAKDELRIRTGGELESWGLLQEAGMQRATGESAYTQGLYGAGSSLLGGASRISSYWGKK